LPLEVEKVDQKPSKPRKKKHSRSIKSAPENSMTRQPYLKPRRKSSWACRWITRPPKGSRRAWCSRQSLVN